MFTVISTKILFNYETYQDVINKLFEYYNNTIIFINDLDLKKFLNSYIIIETNNNVIIREFKGVELYKDLLNLINSFNKKVNVNKTDNKTIILNKKPELIHSFNQKKTLNYAPTEETKEDKERKEYEKLFNETSIIPSCVDLKKSDDIITKLQEFLNIDINSYDINKFDSFIKYIKDVLLMEPIHNNNIEIINKTINMLCNLLTSKFNDKLKDKNIKDIVLLMQEKIKHFNYQVKQLKKQSENQQKFKRENLLNIYKSNLEVYNKIKENNQDLQNTIQDIYKSDTIPEQFKVMYYAYLNSNNLDDFIKAFKEYYHKTNIKLEMFKEFIN